MAATEIRVTSDEMSVEEFLLHYYKPDRLNRELDTAERLTKRYEAEFERLGETAIPRHDCVAGVAAVYGNVEKSDR